MAVSGCCTYTNVAFISIASIQSSAEEEKKIRYSDAAEARHASSILWSFGLSSCNSWLTNVADKREQGGEEGVERVLKLQGCRLPFEGHQSSRTGTDDGAGLPNSKVHLLKSMFGYI